MVRIGGGSCGNEEQVIASLGVKAHTLGTGDPKVIAKSLRLNLIAPLEKYLIISHEATDRGIFLKRSMTCTRSAMNYHSYVLLLITIIIIIIII